MEMDFKSATESFDHAYELLISAVENSRNVFISAPGGCGKSHMMKQLRKDLNLDGITNAIVSTTGTSAYSIGGRTLHSWSGIKLAEGTAEELARSMTMKSRINWRNTSVLMIDEISMLGATLLDKVSKVGQIIRKNTLPFGGIVVVASGDFMQLPPVKDTYAFKDCQTWDDLDFEIITLNTPFRYSDMGWFNRLQRIRFAEHTTEDVEYLKSRCDALLNMDHIKNGVIPTQLFATKAQVADLNQKGLDALPTEMFTFNSTDDVSLADPGAYKEVPNKMEMDRFLDELAPERFEVKVGTQVMLTFNIDVEHGLCNGTRGVVAKIDTDNNRIIIRGVDNRLFAIEPRTLTVTYTRNVTLVRKQYPLILAWAITIHKSQGATLDSLITDLGSSIFNPSMAYVVLSRARSGESVFVTSFSERSIYVDKDAKQYVKAIE